MDIALILPFAFVGVCVLLAVYSAFYMYKFISSYSGKFKKPVFYLFFAVALFTLLIIEFGTTMFRVSYGFAFVLPATALIAFFFILEASRGIYKTEADILIENLEGNKKFLKKKSQLLEEKFLKRKITEDMFKDLLKDLERELIDTDAKISLLQEQRKK